MIEKKKPLFINILLFLWIIQSKRINDITKVRFNPYNVLSYICIILVFIFIFTRELFKVVKNTIDFIFDKDPFKYQ